MKIKKFKSILWMLTITMIVTAINLNAVTYEQLPNRPYWRGFWYCLDMADYPNLISPSMPLKVAQGYSVADSVVKAMPSITHKWNPIEGLHFKADTFLYIYKYWYLMNEHNPLQFFAFKNRKYPDAKNSPSILMSEFKSAMRLDYSRSLYVMVDYILHIYVNATEFIDTSDATLLQGVRPDSNGGQIPTTFIDVKTETIAYCKVLDTIKGGTFPSLNDAIFYNGDSSNIGNPHIIPSQTDLVFSYRDDWSRGKILGHSAVPMFDKNGEKWIKPNKEYIVFLGLMGIDAIGEWDPVGSVHKHYYCISPYYGAGSFNMYPVENGIVKDEQNALGFGTEVPVNIFKQNIINKLEEIKNYGE